MKKLTIAACMAIAAAAFTSCGNGTPSASLKNDVDTLSYAIGMAQSDGLKYYLVERLDVDTAYIDDFLKGVVEGATAGDSKQKNAYFAGVQLGQQLSTQMLKAVNYQLFGEDSTQTASMRNIVAGICAGVKGNGKMSLDEARRLIEVKMTAIKNANMEKQYGDYKKANEKFLADNAKKEGVKQLPSGVQYKVLKEGNGAVPSDTANVVVHYEGKTIDGQVFDSTYKNGSPLTMHVKQTVPGFSQAVRSMPVGSKWEVYIPASLAYGAESRGQIIKPFSTLIFTIELLEIK
ncbi:MAG: FKBP-type peptidyl-prolyl cis-trans isomerase [Prevotellaceae bacterium]|nr:FKBP-type peptidyl-prolyl cis-trans isomerase [Prevotellaceae bacterium]